MVRYGVLLMLGVSVFALPAHARQGRMLTGADTPAVTEAVAQTAPSSAPTWAPLPPATFTQAPRLTGPETRTSAAYLTDDPEDESREWFNEGENTDPLKLRAGVGVYSDYISRGYTQTDERPAVQGYIGLEHESGLYAEIWGSNIDFNDEESQVELDFTLSYTRELLASEDGAHSLGGTAGGMYVWYPGVKNDLKYSYGEIFAGLDASLFNEQLMLGVKGAYSPEYFGKTGQAQYAEGYATVPVNYGDLNIVDVNGGIGYQWIKDNDLYGAPDYMYWSLGISRTWWDKITTSMTYHDNYVKDVDCENFCEGTVVGGVAVDL
jgi:uncharacterized protein (TIGR02001 family)